MRTTPELRIGDAERGAAAAALGDHFAAGRLDWAEFDERMERALVARTGSDLEVLFTDLPRGRTVAVQRPAPRRHGPRPPLLPVLLLFVVAVVVVPNTAVLLLIIGWFVLARSCWRRRRAHDHRCSVRGRF